MKEQLQPAADEFATKTPTDSRLQVTDIKYGDSFKVQSGSSTFVRPLEPVRLTFFDTPAGRGANIR